MNQIKNDIFFTLKSLVFIYISLIACINAYAENDRFNDPIAVDINELILSPEKYDNKVVKLHAFLIMRPENVNLWVSENDYRKRNSGKCMALINQFRDPEKRKLFNEKNVELVGIFHKDIYVYPDGSVRIILSACNSIGMEFDVDSIKILE